MTLVNLVTMTDKFTREEYLTFIEAVKQCENLYNPQHPNYKCNAVREQSWEEISSLMGKPVKECRKKWRHIRDHYMRGHFKSKERHRNWIYYKPLSFLSFLKQERYNCTEGSIDDFEGKKHIGKLTNEDEEDDVFSESDENDHKESKTHVMITCIDPLSPEDSLTVRDEAEDIDTFLKNIGTRLKQLPQQSIDLMKMTILAQVTELELENSWNISGEDANS